jgi:hypothetical protein
MPVDHTPAQRLEQVGMRDRVEILRQIGVDDVRVALVDQTVRLLDGVDRATARPIPISELRRGRLTPV